MNITVGEVAAVLAGHQVEVAWFRRANGWRWWCSCHIDGTTAHQQPGPAHDEAAAHQAEHVAAALAIPSRTLQG